MKSECMLCVNFWWIWFVFDGKTERKENMVKIPVEVGEAFNAYLNLIFFDLLLVYNTKGENQEEGLKNESTRVCPRILFIQIYTCNPFLRTL